MNPPRSLSLGEHRIVRLALVVVLVCACVVCIRAWASGRDDAATAIDEYASAVGQLQRLELLRKQRELVDDRPRPRSEIVEPFKGIMRTIGIGTESLTQVSLPDAQPIQGTPYRRQQGTLTIERVRVVELVNLLAQWSRSQPLWTLRSLRLDKAQGVPASREASGATRESADDRYTAVITIENVHLAAAGVPARSKQP